MPLKTIYSISKNIFSGGTPSTSNDSYWNGHYPWLSSGETSERYIETTLKTITQDGIDNSSTRLAKKNTIVIASAGQGHTRGQTSMLLLDTYINQSIIAIEADSEQVNPYFLFYNLSNRYDELRTLSDGTSSRGSLTTKIIGEMTIDLPSIKKQDAIVHIIKTIDKKILCNNRINDNLEALCQTEYDKLIQDLGVSDSECTLSDLGEIVGGGTPSKTVSEYYCESGIPWITPKDLSDDRSKFISGGNIDLTEFGLNNSSAKMMPRDSILYTSRAPIGYIAISKNNICTNQGFKSVVPKEPYYRSFIYYYLKNNYDLINGVATGSTFLEVSGSAMKGIPIIKPSKEIAESFESYCEPLFKEQEILEDENRQLMALRDYLLPRLMSGEIDVSNLPLPS